MQNQIIKQIMKKKYAYEIKDNKPARAEERKKELTCYAASAGDWSSNSTVSDARGFAIPIRV